MRTVEIQQMSNHQRMRHQVQTAFHHHQHHQSNVGIRRRRSSNLLALPLLLLKAMVALTVTMSYWKCWGNITRSSLRKPLMFPAWAPRATRARGRGARGARGRRWRMKRRRKQTKISQTLPSPLDDVGVKIYIVNCDLNGIFFISSFFIELKNIL